MYLPVNFRETDRADVLGFLQEHPLGLVISAGKLGIQATAVPLVVHADSATDDLRLSLHFARGNTQWRDLGAGSEVLVVVSGAHGYVTPNWYPTKAQTHEHVPTWNYDMVQLRGTSVVHSDELWLREHVESLTTRFESVRDAAWQVSQAKESYLNEMLHGIVGVEVTVTKVEAKWKMNQNRLPEDAQGAYRGLSDASDPHYNPAVAARVLEENEGRFES